MSRGATLDQLVEQVRSECRLSTDSSRGMESRSMLVQVINRVYETLFDDYDWNFLFVTKEDSAKKLQAGQRYYDAPESMDVDAITGAWTKYGGQWVPLSYGIGFDEYNQYDSEADIRCDPVMKWQVRDDEQIEVWPIPATNDLDIAFEGKRKFVRLSANSDRCLLDDSLVTLFASAEILQGNKQEDSKLKLQLATARLNKLRAKATGKTRVRVGLGRVENARLGRHEQIKVAYVRNP